MVVDDSVPFQVAVSFPFHQLGCHSTVVLVGVAREAEHGKGEVVAVALEDQTAVVVAVAVCHTMVAGEEERGRSLDQEEAELDDGIHHLDQTDWAVGHCRTGLRPLLVAAVALDMVPVVFAESAPVPPSIRAGCSPSSLCPPV